MRIKSAIAICALAAGSAAAVDPNFHVGDVYLDVVNGQIALGAFNPSTNTLTIPGCVFVSTLIPQGQFGVTNDPGFDSPNGTFGTGEFLGVNIRSSLAFWDGTQLIHGGPERIALSQGAVVEGPDGPVWSPLTQDTLVRGFTIGVNGLGEWHEHIQSTLFNLEDTSGLRDGAYALEMEIFAEPPSSLATSEPFWFVYDWNATDQELNNAFAAAVALSACGSPSCEADITGPALDGVPDGTVDASDLTLFLNSYVAEFGGPGAVDFTGPSLDGVPDGVVDAADLTIYLNRYVEQFGGC